MFLAKLHIPIVVSMENQHGDSILVGKKILKVNSFLVVLANFNYPHPIGTFLISPNPQTDVMFFTVKSSALCASDPISFRLSKHKINKIGFGFAPPSKQKMIGSTG